MDIAEYSTDTPAVVAAGARTGDWVATTLEGATVAACADPVAVLDGDEREVDCLAVGPDVGDVAETIRRLGERVPECPILYVDEDPTPSALATASAAGATRVMLRDDTAGTSLQSAVEDLVTVHDRRRQRRREQGMFRTILETFPQSIYVKDREARIVACSDAVERGVDGNPIGQTDLGAFGDETGEANARETYEDDRRVLRTGDPIVDAEERHDREDDETLWLETNKFPWTVDGDVVGLVGETRDVTAAKRREHDLEHEKQRLEQFATFASHDLRNPLTVADGHIKHAMETGETGSLAAASDAIDRMERLIDDLLNIVDPNATTADEEWTDLSGVTRRAWEAVDADGATLGLALPEDLRIRAASGALRQLLENLLSNAVHHAGPDVTVTVGTTPTGFFVADDGPGIPAADREHVFEHGFTTGGTGVGLAVAAEIADAHDWEPRVLESDSGGARFEFNRCLRRREDEPCPTEGDVVPLSGTSKVGDTAIEGASSDEGEGRWQLSGAGRALWGGIEEYVAVHGTIEGDCRIEARLVDLTEIHEYSKAGVVVADAIEPGRPLGFVGATAAHGHEAAWRPHDDDPVETVQIGDGDVIPGWYRIDRIGERLTCYTSVDGENWRPVDQHVLDVEDPVAAGIAINSHERDEPADAVFEDVRLVELEARRETDSN